LQTADSPNEKANAQIALKLIADHRNSTYLKTVLQADRNEIDISVVEAYDALGASVEVSDEVLLTNYENMVNGLFYIATME
jgi:hypothetical protein